MISRFSRSLGSLAILIVAYWAYALIAVPLIEPAATAGHGTTPTEEEIAAARGARSHERKQLERWFAPGSWEITSSMVIETPRGKLLMKEYEALPDGRLKVQPCTMVFLSESVGNEEQRLREAVILQAPGGVELTFDEPIDMQRGKVGNIVGGKLKDQFTIRSDHKQPGPADDLLIVARDAVLENNRVVSPHKIEFRLGANQGSGRDVEIDLGTGTIGGKKEAGAMQLEGIKSFTLKREVVVFLDAGKGSLLGGLNKPADAAQGLLPGPAPWTQTVNKPASNTKSKPTAVAGMGATDELPLRIACQGPFCFNMAALEASFQDQVDVLRMNSGGQSDRLQCQRLSMFFAPVGGPAPGTIVDDKPAPMGKLQPVRLEARGQPVTVDSPADDVEAVGELLRYNLQTKEVSLEGEHPVMLRRGPNRITAPRVEFQPSTSKRFGRVSAEGPGKLEGVAPDDPTRKFAASWKQQLSFTPDGPNHVFSLRGDARAEMIGYGGLSAEEIHVWVFEKPREGAPLPPGRHMTGRPVGGAAPSPGGGLQNMPFAPQRMMATGNVQLDAVQLIGRVKELQVWFKPALPAAGQLPDGRSFEELPAPAGALVGPRPGPRPPAAAPGQLGGLKPRQRFQVTGGLLQAEVLVGPAVTNLGKLRIHERAQVVETQTQDPNEKPFVVRGNDIDYEQTDPTNGVLVVTGEPVAGKWAHIEGRGLTLDGGVIRLDRGRNELTINGPGALGVPVPRNLAGQPAQTDQSLGVRWQRGLIFDGNIAHFTEKVICEFDHHQLRTEQLDVTFRDRVNFGGTPGQTQTQPELGAIACHGPVLLDGRTYANGQVESIERMQAFDLTYDRASGAVHAAGPGEMTMVRRGAPQFAPPGAPRQMAANPKQTSAVRRAPTIRMVSNAQGTPSAGGEELPIPASAGAASSDALTYVHVEFPNELRGTLPMNPGDVRPRVVQFSERVKTTYGPVSSWNEKIDADDIDRQLAAGEPAPKSVVFMSSNLLTVTELPTGPAAQRGIELDASGNVEVEGINFETQNFFARGDRMSYAAAKDLLILEGDGRAPAVLARQNPHGAASGRKILFWPASQRIKVDGAQSIDFTLPGR